MDSIILLGQKNTLAESMILFETDNHPLMLDKDLYDSWKSRMKLYMKNKEHKRMILESVENGPLIWPTIEENGVIRTKKFAELSAVEKIQVDCDMNQYHSSRYTTTTVLGLLQEAARIRDVKIDWNLLAKRIGSVSFILQTDLQMTNIMQRRLSSYLN
nr:hypothetical protein [Tanacetum cinerariifolium]